ncbi:MAG: hypothetical protein ACKV2V_15755 [Blastocatellia bacterium]
MDHQTSVNLHVLPENLFAAAEVTGERRDHDLAVHYLLDREWFDPLQWRIARHPAALMPS